MGRRSRRLILNFWTPELLNFFFDNGAKRGLAGVVKALEEVAAQGIEEGGGSKEVLWVVECEGVELEGKRMGAGEDFLESGEGLRRVGGRGEAG